MRVHVLFSLLFVISSLKTSSSADWCYQSQVTCDKPCKDPTKWSEVAKTCGGQNQSPINIVTKRAQLDESLKPLQYTDYQKAFHSYIINNGHSVQVNLPDSAKINGGNLETTYKALQLHFHWGDHGGPGSEHTIDGEQYPMEMHIVHMKQKYDSLSQALEDKNGVAVLGFFYQESQSSNKKYDSIVNALKNITEPETNTTVTDLTLDMLIPPQSDLSTYYRYQGSLTTPNCDESVVWTVFESAILLSKEQLSAFSKLKYSAGQNMTGNYRPVQPLYGRQVYRSGGVVVWINTVVLLSSVLGAVGLSLPD